MIGSYLEDETAVDSGAAYVYTLNGETWTEQYKLKPPTPVSGADYGGSLGVSYDGLSVIVGAYGETSGGLTYSGAVYYYV